MFKNIFSGLGSGLMDTVWGITEGVKSISTNDVFPSFQDVVVSSVAMTYGEELLREDDMNSLYEDVMKKSKSTKSKAKEVKAEESKAKSEHEENLDKEVEALINDMGRDELRAELSKACDELQKVVNESIKEQYSDKVETESETKAVDMKDIVVKTTKAIKGSLDRIDREAEVVDCVAEAIRSTIEELIEEPTAKDKIKEVEEAKSCPVLGMSEEDFDDINSVINFAYGDDGYDFDEEDVEDEFEYTVEDLDEYQNNYDPEDESECIAEIKAGEYMGEGGMSIIITDTQYIIPKDSELAQDEYVKSRGVEIGMGVYTNLVERNVKMITEDSYLVPTATTNIQDNYVFINRPEMKPWEYMTKEGKVLIKTKDGLVARKEEATVLEDETQQELNEEQAAQLKAITENWNSNQSK